MNLTPFVKRYPMLFGEGGVLLHVWQGEADKEEKHMGESLSHTAQK